MDLRTSTSLFCGALALAIAASILLRGRPQRAHWLFAAFAADVGLWYLAQWLYHFVRADVWARFTALLAVLLPQFALHLFAAISPSPPRGLRLLRWARALLAPMLVLALSQWHRLPLARATIFLYVFGLIAAGLIALLRRGEQSGSRSTQRRVRFLVFSGALAATFSLADFLWFIGISLPPVGAVLSIVFLFTLAESLIRKRLVDAYEVLGLVLVSTALAFSLAGLFYVFVVLWGAFQDKYLNAVLAGIVMLVLFEPLRDKMRGYISRVFFLERVDLERCLRQAEHGLARAIETEAMTRVALGALEDSRRFTAAALYLRDESTRDFSLGGSFGPTPPERLGVVSVASLLDLLRVESSVNFRDLATRATAFNGEGGDQHGALLAEAQALGPFASGVVVPIRAANSELVGLLLVHDDRVQDALSAEDIALLEHLGAQLAVVVENSERYRRMQEQAHLAALGQMAAGLAHEVKNPLGAIKGSAQLLRDSSHASNVEFVDIILEEVERLDRVVGSVLAYARPGAAVRDTVDVNAVVERTLRVINQELDASTRVSLEPARDLPMVRADAEQLRQVLFNLVRNAVQSAQTGGRSARVVVRTCERVGNLATRFVEVSVADNGDGVAPQAMANLFTPFFTTKSGGSGLGLAISQRLAQEMHGKIELSSTSAEGATFALILPAVVEKAALPASLSVPAGAARD